MKLVELLARELSEWPEEAAHASQDYDREIRFYNADEDQLSLFDFFVDDHADDACDAITFAGGGVRVTRSQWQAERDRQKGGEWKRHRGNSQPVDEGTYVEVKLRCGDIQQGLANAFLWRHFDCDVAANIMKYRVISQPQAKEVEYLGPFPCAPAGTTFNEIELDIHYPSGVCSVEFKTEQMENPFKWRDTVNELDAYIEEFTREREALINRLAEEGFALLPAMTPVMGVSDALVVIPCEEWIDGDIVRCVDIDLSAADLTPGEEYTVVTRHGEKGVIDDAGDHMCSCIETGELEFVRRP